MRIPHLTLDFSSRHQSGDGIDDNDIHGAAPDQHIGDFKRLLAGVRLRHQEFITIHTEFLGINRIQGMLGIDESGDAALPLGIGHRMKGQGRFARRFRAIDLDNPATGQSADAQRLVKGKGSG